MKAGLAKAVRILTVPQLMALMLILLMPEAFPGIDTWWAVFFLCLMPILAYPVCWAIPVLRKGGRARERMLSIIFCVTGYVGGVLYGLLQRGTRTALAVYLTYLVSGILVAVFSYAIKIKGSGHACGAAGPIAMLVWQVSPWYLLGGAVLLAAVFWCSLTLKRHTWPQLFLGSAFPVGTIALLAQVL